MVGNIDSGRGCVCGREQEICGNAVLSAQFCCEPKTVKKKKVYEKIISHK